MQDKIKTIQAIDRLCMTLMVEGTRVAPQETACVHESTADRLTGISPIDDLLPYADAEGERDALKAQWLFLRNVRHALLEPPDSSSGRGRKGEANAAAEHLRAAGQSLSKLGSEGLALALEQLAETVATLAHASVIEVSQLSSHEIVPGTRLLAQHTPYQMSAYHTSKRGRTSHRAELIRFVCHTLRTDAPPTAVASLVSEVLGINCSHADVQQARGHQAQSNRDSRTQQDEAAIKAALKQWGV